VKIFGEQYRVRARVEEINALSAHADRDELLGYLQAANGRFRHAFVVHGELPENEAVASALRQMGVPDVAIPTPHQTFEL